MSTLPRGLATLRSAYVASADGTILAGALRGTVPITIGFLRLRRQFISSRTVGAMRG